MSLQKECHVRLLQSLQYSVKEFCVLIFYSSLRMRAFIYRYVGTVVLGMRIGRVIEKYAPH